MGARVALIHLEFRVPGASSLKDKRRWVKGFKDRLSHRWNVSVAEVDGLDEIPKRQDRQHPPAREKHGDLEHAALSGQPSRRFSSSGPHAAGRGSRCSPRRDAP